MRLHLYRIARGFPLRDQLHLQGVALCGTDEQVEAALYEAEEKLSNRGEK